MIRRKLKLLIGVALLILALVVAGGLWWRARERQEIVVASLPLQPKLQGKPAELLQRVVACEQRIRAGSDAAGALVELSNLYHANGFLTEASQCYQGLMRIDPSNPRWTHRLATIIAGYGQLDDALLLWRRTIALDDNYTPAKIRLADALLKANQSAEAIKIYERVLKREPANPYALVGLARFDVDAGRWAAARDRLEKATEGTDYSIGSDLLVTVCEQLGDNARAESIRSRGKASGGFFDIPDLWIRELAYDCYDSYQLSLNGAVSAREGDLSAAISLVERAVTYEPKNGYYIVQAANLYLQSGNRDKARKHLENAIIVAPDNSDTWLNLARFYKSSGQIKEAELTVTNGLIHCPDSPSLVFVRGQTKLAADRLEDAIPDFQKVAAALNDDASPSFELARIYSRLDRLPEALAALQKALIAEPEYPPALAALAIYYISKHDEPSAQKWMQKVKAQPRVKPQDRLDLERTFQQQFGHPPY